MEIIIEDYVSFDTAKLLKEKGFDWPCRAYITLDDEGHSCFIAIDNICKEDLLDLQYLCPTHQMAMKWLREVHNTFVCIVLLEDIDGYGFTVENTLNKKYVATSKNDGYSTYEEACEAAIKYCLENLI